MENIFIKCVGQRDLFVNDVVVKNIGQSKAVAIAVVNAGTTLRSGVVRFFRIVEFLCECGFKPSGKSLVKSMVSVGWDFNEFLDLRDMKQRGLCSTGCAKLWFVLGGID